MQEPLGPYLRPLIDQAEVERIEKETIQGMEL
jgi:hypothetical protein